MTQEELLKELLAKLPTEIVEKIKAKTLTKEDVEQYIKPLYKQFKDQFEGFAPLSDEQLDAVEGASGFTDLLGRIGSVLGSVFSGSYSTALGDNESKAKLMEAGRRERVR